MAGLIQDRKPHLIDRLLRCRKTNRYFSEGGWTADPRRASVYADEIEAARACVAHGLSEVDLVLRRAGTTAELFATQLR